MKRLHVLPSDPNILDSFYNDSIDRNIDVVRFCNLLDSIDDSYTIAVDGQWGCGKTFFVKHVKLVLDYKSGAFDSRLDTKPVLERFLNASTPLGKELCVSKKHISIYYDAWENDNSVDPVLSIIYAVLKANKLWINTKKLDFVSIISSIVEVATGKNITKVLTAVKGTSVFADFEKDETVEKLVGRFIDAVLPNSQDRLIIFIDELDRCNPSFAIQLLERIKHFFNDERITFIFSVNIEQLQHTVRNYYGQSFDAYRYLEKLFDLVIHLPNCNYEKYLSSLHLYDTQYVSRKVCRCVAKVYKLELRELSKFVQMLKLSGMDNAMEKASCANCDEKALAFSITYVLPIMIGLLIIDLNRYLTYINGYDATPLQSVLLCGEMNVLDISNLFSMEEIAAVNAAQKPDALQKDHLEKLYHAIFVESYDTIRQVQVGGMQFEKGIRLTLFKMIGLVSQYTSTKNVGYKRR